MRLPSEKILIAAAVMHDAGALADDPSERRKLSERELLERIARLSKAERQRAIVRGRQLLGWSR